MLTFSLELGCAMFQRLGKNERVFHDFLQGKSLLISISYIDHNKEITTVVIVKG